MSSQLSSSDRLGYDPAALWKHFTPQIRTGGDLLPADSFNHPNLKARPDNITDSLADLCMDIQIGKACAGLNYKYRASGAEVRRAFKVRDFPPQVMESLHWGVPSMREEQVGRMIATCGLSISELAAGFRRAFGDGACGYADYLNGWAFSPENPPRRRDVWLSVPEANLIAGDAPNAIFSVWEGHPRWMRYARTGEVTIALDHLHYCFEPDVLRQAQENWFRRQRIPALIHRRLAKMLPNIDCRIICVSELSKPFSSEDGTNDYEIFDAVKGRYGVYVFVDESNDFLYVGEAHYQSLKERITQNYTENDTGGTFRENWCEQEGDFGDFKNNLGKWRVVTVSTSIRNDDWIQPFESELIELLKPKYNERK